jgi:hypothetical protein
MAGYSPSLPLRRDSDYGYALNQNMIDVIRQNFKNLVLTNPGERMMIPDFGVGIRTFLFEMNDQTTQGNIRAALDSQVKKYMSFIGIKAVAFNIDEFNFPNSLGITIFYDVLPLNLSDVLEITIGA